MTACLGWWRGKEERIEGGEDGRGRGWKGERMEGGEEREGGKEVV